MWIELWGLCRQWAATGATVNTDTAHVVEILPGGRKARLHPTWGQNQLNSNTMAADAPVQCNTQLASISQSCAVENIGYIMNVIYE